MTLERRLDKLERARGAGDTGVVHSNYTTAEHARSLRCLREALPAILEALKQGRGGGLKRGDVTETGA